MKKVISCLLAMVLMLSVSFGVSAEGMTKEEAKAKARELIELYSYSSEYEIFDEYGRGNWFALEDFLTNQIYNNNFVYEDWYDIWKKSVDDYSYVNSTVTNIASYATEKKGMFGLAANLENGSLVVQAVSNGSPAMKAGIVVGSVILSYGDVTVPETAAAEDLTAFQNYFAGVDTAPITVKLPTGEALTATITRADFVEDEVMEDITIVGDTAYMIIPSFNLNSDEYFARGYKKAEEAGVKSIIFDLRTNTGGYVMPCYNMLNTIIPEKLPMYYDKYARSIATSTSDGLGSKTWRPDIVCLTTGNTASAAESFAGTLQYHGYARIVGEKTYGKSVLQDMLSLSDGNVLVLTTAEGFLPNGKSWQGKGLTPDYVIKDDLTTHTDEVLDFAYNYVDGKGTEVEEPGYYSYIYYLKEDSEPEFLDTFAAIKQLKLAKPTRITYVSKNGMKMIVDADDAYGAANLYNYFGIYSDQSSSAEKILKEKGLPEKARVIMTATEGDYGFAPTVSFKMADKPTHFYYYDSVKNSYTEFEPPYVYEDGVLRFNIETGGIIIASPEEIK
ncbi:MAG: hypothetical protein LBL98_07415 [Ruminococcus sp.]|jgi:C-terminal peptidase prc|nr:hypothetical protein [Ruminococcus sp.]